MRLRLAVILPAVHPSLPEGQHRGEESPVREAEREPEALLDRVQFGLAQPSFQHDPGNPEPLNSPTHKF